MEMDSHSIGQTFSLLVGMPSFATDRVTIVPAESDLVCAAHSSPSLLGLLQSNGLPTTLCTTQETCSSFLAAILLFAADLCTCPYISDNLLTNVLIVLFWRWILIFPHAHSE